ncbi:unnamed protein product [Darwinula stevensoni]|uniref:Anoctamin n=1 Tax=Darwinula stevensoni TaxID=69355 RepID=A0A7R8ZZN7_9CRUS|nr:unnamed protein product [Darwinula stevensoni]CAG0884101.1 unnamed protein product [Darwinula stevensoni]
MDDIEAETNGEAIRMQELSEGKSPDLYFQDGRRCIDFILAWKMDDQHLQLHHVQRREVFEKNLEEEGLELEFEDNVESQLRFIKVHAPWEVLTRYAEILKLKMPMRELRGMDYEIMHPHAVVKEVEGWLSSCLRVFQLDEYLFPPQEKTFTATYSRDKEYLFNMKEDIFTSSMRSRIVDFILCRKHFRVETKACEMSFGVQKLLMDRTYDAAYPLHDGDLVSEGSIRHLLRTEWGSLRKLHKCQPLECIKDYYGVKISLYFAWLGFYTYMLIPASIVGLICFLYGCFSLYSNEPSEDICNQHLNITMCPICDHLCDFWHLEETCLHARITYLFDNPATLFFAIFMSFWSAMFLEFWKRYSAEISHQWDLTGFDIREEHPRPEYLARLSSMQEQRLNYVTKMLEPHVSFWKMKVPGLFISCISILLLISLALVAVMAVILYRMSMVAALSLHGDSYVTSYAMLITTTTAASINLCCILVFNQLYNRLATYLTELELPRTQSEFDDSLTLKIYLLQFVNYYASIFYIAFFKGSFIGYPGSYKRLFGFRQEECGPGGCLMELCIQLGIIMVGKQAMNTVLEMFWPIFFKWLQLIQLGVKEVASHLPSTRWGKDYKLVDFGTQGLFNEYCEMVLQFGFVTIFVAAFPLAPLFALINNIFEMRLDARKLLTYYRRPVAQRVIDIGIWYTILESVGKLAVLTNAFIIAFTSNFIPRIVYRMNVSPDDSLKGFLNHSLAYFNVSDFPPEYAPQVSGHSVCRYPDYREPYWREDKYNPTSMFWHVLAARLAFVVVFQNLVFGLINVIRWIIPDTPGKLKDKIRREAYLTNEIIMEQELLRSKTSRWTGAFGKWAGQGNDKDPLPTHRTQKPASPGGAGDFSSEIQYPRLHVMDKEDQAASHYYLFVCP